MGHARPGLPETVIARAFGDVAQHDTEMKPVVPCQPPGCDIPPLNKDYFFEQKQEGNSPTVLLLKKDNKKLYTNLQRGQPTIYIIS
jgi:hypothetical protein